MIQHALQELLERRDLTRDESREVMDSVMRGEAILDEIGRAHV